MNNSASREDNDNDFKSKLECNFYLLNDQNYCGQSCNSHASFFEKNWNRTRLTRTLLMIKTRTRALIYLLVTFACAPLVEHFFMLEQGVYTAIIPVINATHNHQQKSYHHNDASSKNNQNQNHNLAALQTVHVQFNRVISRYAWTTFMVCIFPYIISASYVYTNANRLHMRRHITRLVFGTGWSLFAGILFRYIVDNSGGQCFERGHTNTGKIVLTVKSQKECLKLSVNSSGGASNSSAATGGGLAKGETAGVAGGGFTHFWTGLDLSIGVFLLVLGNMWLAEECCIMKRWSSWERYLKDKKIAHERERSLSKSASVDTPFKQACSERNEYKQILVRLTKYRALIASFFQLAGLLSLLFDVLLLILLLSPFYSLLSKLCSVMCALGCWLLSYKLWFRLRSLVYTSIKCEHPRLAAWLMCLSPGLPGDNI